MPGYFWCSFHPTTKRPGKACGIHDGDWWQLTGLVVDLADAARYKQPICVGAKVPTLGQVAALPGFDPEQYLLLGKDPDWKHFGGADSTARYCTATTVARHVKAMRAIDACVGDHSARESWERYLAALTRLVARKQGLYCSTDE